MIQSSHTAILGHLTTDRPCAVVALAEGGGLERVLEQLSPLLPSGSSLWLSGRPETTAELRVPSGMSVTHLDSVEYVSLVLTGVDAPVPVPRLLLDPVQLIFVGQNLVSKDGYLLGAMHSLLALMPRSYRLQLADSVPDLLLALYRRFGHETFLLPTHLAKPAFMSGNPLAMDESMIRAARVDAPRPRHLAPERLIPVTTFVPPEDVRPLFTESKLLQDLPANVRDCQAGLTCARLAAAAKILVGIVARRVKRRWNP
jgi:hypothetical protein